MHRRKFEHTVEVRRILQALEETPSDGEEKCNRIRGTDGGRTCTHVQHRGVHTSIISWPLRHKHTVPPPKKLIDRPLKRITSVRANRGRYDSGARLCPLREYAV